MLGVFKHHSFKQQCKAGVFSRPRHTDLRTLSIPAYFRYSCVEEGFILKEVEMFLTNPDILDELLPWNKIVQNKCRSSITQKQP